MREIRSPSQKIVLDRDLLVEVVRRERERGRTIVTTNGCFDMLHVGHVRYLYEASRYGDILIVAVNSDDSVRRLKGPLRPIFPQRERAEMVAALECVDYVTIFDEDTPIPLIEAVRPDFHVKGGDYTLEEMIEREAVERVGGKPIVGVKVEGRSTTEIIRDILKRFQSHKRSRVER
jgi:rfaE bifunctional protein nucleotidyltransferase chain/domain